MKRKIGWLVVLLVFVFVGGLFAQEQTGQIVGTVKDETGAVLPGVTILAKSPSLVGYAKTVTDKYGYYRLLNLPPGTYTITASLEGFATVKRENIELRLGKVLRVDFTMKVAAVAETITVTGEAPLVDVKKSASAMSITKEMFTTLPRGRNFLSVVDLSPSANFENMFGGRLSVDGASSSENVFFVDGLDTSSMYTGNSLLTVPFEFVDEIQVKTGGYEAEYGGSMGGVINVVTRSGGDTFHGEGVLYYNGSSVAGGPQPILRLDPLDPHKAQYLTYDEDTWYRLEPGFNLGGYIKKGKVWFYNSYIPVYSRTKRHVTFVPSGIEGDYTQKQYTHNLIGKITAQLSSKMRVSGSYDLNWYKWIGDLPSRAGTDNPDKNWADTGYVYPRWSGAVNFNYIPNQNLMFSARAGYFYTNVKQLLGPPGPRYYFVNTSNIGIPGIPPEHQHGTYWANYSYDDGYQTKKDIRTRTMARGDATYFFRAGGEHNVKTGVQFVRIAEDVDDAYAHKYYRIYWDRTYHSSFIGGDYKGTYGYLEVRWPFGVVANIHSDRWAIYAQDSWTIKDRLTINYGVRLEKEDIPSFSDLPEYQYPPIAFGFTDKVAPRIGFAYDVEGDGNSKLFGSWGIYYDVMKLALAEGSYGGFKWISTYYPLNRCDFWNWTDDTDFGEPIEAINWRIPSFDTTDPDLKPTAQWELSLGYERKLSDVLALSIRYIRKRLIRTIEDVGVATPEGEVYYITNPGFGLSQKMWAEGYPKTPKAVRHYDAIEVRFEKRYSDNWMGGLSYTWSRLWGNYAGLASSDEYGRQDPNVERYFDLWFMNFDQNGNEVLGLLPTDRPHRLKLYGTYHFDFGMNVGLTFFAMSGTPVSTMITLNNLQGYYPVGRGDMGRTPFYTMTNIYVDYNFKIGKYTAQINCNIDNLFNQKIAQRVYAYYNMINIALTDEEIMAGFDYKTLVPPDELDPRYGKEYSYTSKISARIGFRLIF